MSNQAFVILLVVFAILAGAAIYFHTPAGQSIHSMISSFHGW
jgi:hypothetical protein